MLLSLEVRITPDALRLPLNIDADPGVIATALPAVIATEARRLITELETSYKDRLDAVRFVIELTAKATPLEVRR